MLSPGAQSADLAHYVHHQSADRYDVLRSKPVALADAQRVNADDVDAIHRATAKFYRLIFIDSGNDESDPLWKRMIDLCDQLVVATTKDEHAEAGVLLLEALAERDDRSAALADDAVVVVSETNNTAKPAEAHAVRDSFSKLAREAVTIPYDPAMVDGITGRNTTTAPKNTPNSYSPAPPPKQNAIRTTSKPRIRSKEAHMWAAEIVFDPGPSRAISENLIVWVLIAVVAATTVLLAVLAVRGDFRQVRNPHDTR